jgi:hypothetical protein
MISPTEAYQDLNSEAPGKYTREQAEDILKLLYKLANLNLEAEKRKDEQESDNIYQGIN